MFDDDATDDEIPPEFALALANVAIEILEIGDGDAIARRYEKYVDDPIEFARCEVGINPWESSDPEQAGQADVIREITTSDRVAVKSGHKTSKSCTAAILALWWVATRVGARAVLSAPAFHQIKNIIWKELRDRFRQRPLALGLGAEPALDPGTGLQLPNGNQIIGISTKTKENLAGLSAARIFFIIDEASGFPDDLFETIMGNSAGGSKIFAISNPTRTKGWFFRLFRARAAIWSLFTLSSENSPNVVAGKELIPGLAKREWIEEMRGLCGPDYERDATYMVRVLGEFPGQGTDSVISTISLDRAVARWKPAHPLAAIGDLVIGVDVARFGNDDNVIFPVRGTYAFEPLKIDTSIARDDPELTASGMVASAVIRRAKALRQGVERVRVNVDGIGVGAAVVDALKVSKEVAAGWLYVVDMNVAESADEEPTLEGDDRVNFENLRSQLWFGVAAWLRTGALPNDDELHAELLAATYGFKRNRIMVESKDKMRAALGKSPDYADALCLACYRGTRGSWTEFAYDAAEDPRHPKSRDRPKSDFWLPGRDDDDDGGGGGSRGGGSYSFF